VKPHPLAKPQAALLLALCSLCLCGSAHALDPELTTPYKVKVVLQVAPNRLLTPIFREQLRRDLRQGLQGALGAMGEVEVIDLAEVKDDQREPLWREVAAKGLQTGLDTAPKATTDIKTHFVRVDYVDGQYEIQARQYDGLTGLVSPSVRHKRTPDRQFVARAAALLVDQDFGLVGTVTDGDGPTARVAFRGGGLKVPLDRWVKKGDLFGLVQVGADGKPAYKRWYVLQAEAAPGEDGSCTCKVMPPLRLQGGAGSGFRCFKLGTVRAPVRVRVVEGGKIGGRPRPMEAIVEVHRRGFDDPSSCLLTTDADGYASTEKKEPPYDGLAFVTVRSGGQLRTQVPVVLEADRTVIIPITVGREPAGFLPLRNLWEGNLTNDQIMLKELFPSLSKDLEKVGAKAALERAQKVLDELDKKLPEYDKDRAELAQFKPVTGTKPLDLSRGDRALTDVRQARQELREWVGRVDKILKEGGNTDAQQVKLDYEKAQNFEKEGDYGRAIALYDQVFAKTKDAKLGERLTKLKAAWETKGEDHAKARAFIYDTWPKLEAPSVMKERVKQAREALAVCRKVKDPLGPRKLLMVAKLHATKLGKQAEDLSQDTKETDTAAAQELSDVLEGLLKLIEEAGKAVAENPAP
jgi:hypothetical protein